MNTAQIRQGVIDPASDRPFPRRISGGYWQFIANRECRGMPLLSLLSTNPDAVRQLTIEQVVATAGDGRLRDATEAQVELREYMRQASVDTLASHADYCLANSFNKSGHVLQDIVNELGRRLEYTVENGRYQGTSATVGFDGIWREPRGHSLVVEVKTTDAYRLSLDSVASYRDRLLAQGALERPCSILIVVGRTDTGELEAQVRGSRHAWDIRLISIDSLLSLVRIKESADSSDTIAKIRRLLTPMEYTRLDDLVEVMFATTRDVETSIENETRQSTPEEAPAATKESIGSTGQEKRDIVEVRERIVAAIGRNRGVTYVRKSRAQYWDPNHLDRLVCVVSSRYEDQGPVKYWFAYHPQQHAFLVGGEAGHFVLGFIDLDVAYSVPADVMRTYFDQLYVTKKKDGSFYYHVKLAETGTESLSLQLRGGDSGLSLAPYAVILSG